MLGALQKCAFRACLLTRKQRDFCSFIPLFPQRETERREMKSGAGRERVGVFLKGLEDRESTGLEGDTGLQGQTEP